MNQLCTWQAFKKKLREHASRSTLVLAPNAQIWLGDFPARQALTYGSPHIVAEGMTTGTGVF